MWGFLWMRRSNTHKKLWSLTVFLREFYVQMIDILQFCKMICIFLLSYWTVTTKWVIVWSPHDEEAVVCAPWSHDEKTTKLAVASSNIFAARSHFSCARWKVMLRWEIVQLQDEFCPSALFSVCKSLRSGQKQESRSPRSKKIKNKTTSHTLSKIAPLSSQGCSSHVHFLQVH